MSAGPQCIEVDVSTEHLAKKNVIRIWNAGDVRAGLATCTSAVGAGKTTAAGRGGAGRAPKQRLAAITGC